jgi:hypothetical protein
MLPRKGLITHYLIFENIVPFSSSVVRRVCLEETGGFKEHLPMAIDWDLWLRISAHWEFDYINEPLIYYRMGHSEQLSRNIRVRQKCCDMIMMEFIRDFPGAVTTRDLRQAKAYAHTLRGQYYNNRSIINALWHYALSAIYAPLHIAPYRGMFRTMFPCISTAKAIVSKGEQKSSGTDPS